jgi:hypothetical protein
MAQNSYDDADDEKTKEVSFSKRERGKTSQLDVKQIQKDPMTLDNYFGELR